MIESLGLNPLKQRPIPDSPETCPMLKSTGSKQGFVDVPLEASSNALANLVLNPKPFNRPLGSRPVRENKGGGVGVLSVDVKEEHVQKDPCKQTDLKPP